MHRGPVNSCDPPVSPFDNGFSLFFSFLTSAIPLDFSLFLLHSGRHCCNLVHAQHRSLTFTFPCSFLTACYKKSSPRAILNLNSDDDDNGDTLPSIEDHYTLQVHWPSNTNGDWSFAWTMRGWLRPLCLHKTENPDSQDWDEDSPHRGQHPRVFKTGRSSYPWFLLHWQDSIGFNNLVALMSM